ARALDHGADRQADVSAHLRRYAGAGEDVSDQAGGGGLAVRSGDADIAAAEKRRGQFHFADDANAPQAGFLQRDEVGGNVGREDDEAGAFEDRRSLQRERNLEPAEFGAGVREIGERLKIGSAYDGAAA